MNVSSMNVSNASSCGNSDTEGGADNGLLVAIGLLVTTFGQAWVAAGLLAINRSGQPGEKRVYLLKTFGMGSRMPLRRCRTCIRCLSTPAF